MTKNSFKIWYNDGLKFKCTGCGKCCTGSDGYVWLTEKDIDAFCLHLNLTREAFLKKYTRFVDTAYALIDKKGGDECIFLEDNKCTAYGARPSQCKKFPFWSGNLSSRKQWEDLKEECEGVDHEEGKLYTRKEIDRIRSTN